MEDVFAAYELPRLAISGTTRRFPVHRIYCAGRNYADHLREMGKDPGSDPPCFFLKPPDSVLTSGATVAYPLRTQNFQPEVELVVAVGKGGTNIERTCALEHVFGYAVGNDLTRRDLQLQARSTGQPWDAGKAFDDSAAIGTVHPVAAVGHMQRGAIWLSVDGELRQEADLSEMIWDVSMIIAELSQYYVLRPGDIIFTGTPAGVAPIHPKQRVIAGIDGLDSLELIVGEAVHRTPATR